MIYLVILGLLSGMFFSSTFILNRVMSLEGGHWVWSSSLRYGYMILLLIGILWLSRGIQTVGGLFRLYIRHWKFWTIAGSIGFGGFYSMICFSADHAPGWIVATTWQLTIIATLVVLISFGQRFPRKIWLFSSIVFAGVLTVNLSYFEDVARRDVLMGGLPVLIAAFCYPIGNQLVWEAKHGHARLPDINDSLVDNPFGKVFLLSLGSVPFWLVLIAICRPSAPSAGQLVNTAMVALFSGIIATSLFLFARNRARRAGEVAAVDATQSSETVFAMIGEMLILNAPLPNGFALLGVAMVFVGLALFVRFQEAVE